MKHFPYPTSARIRFINFFRKMLRYQAIEWLLIALIRKISFTKKIIPPEYLYLPNSYRVVVRDGVKYRLDLSDVVGHSLYFFNRYFTPEKFVNIIEDGWAIVDVGAHIGTSALRAAHASIGGTILAFEASQKNFEALAHNIQLNSMTNVVPINKGIGSSNQTAILYHVNSYNSGMNRFLTEKQDCDFELIEVTTLDEEIERLNISNVDLIKIDVEGYELQVLQGAKLVLEKFRPKLIIELVESNLESQGYSAADVVHFLKGFNYHCIDLNTGKALQVEPGVETDIFCFV